jgi:hypothetical protein
MATDTKVTRRGLFRFFAGFGPAAMFRESKPAPPPPPAPPVKRVYLAEVYIAGFRYYEGMRPEVLAMLQPGVDLELRRQADNRYDDNAIAVFTADSRKLGYLPRSENALPAAIADQDVPLGAEITEVAPDAQPWRRVRIHVYQKIYTG